MMTWIFMDFYQLLKNSHLIDCFDETGKDVLQFFEDYTKKNWAFKSF